MSGEISVLLRALLLVGAFGAAAYIVRKIRRSKIQLEEAIFWIFFCIALVLLSVFPNVVMVATRILKIESPINFVFLCIIFVLIVKVFLMSLHISELEEKLRTLAQEMALQIKKEKDEKDAGSTPPQ